MNHAIAGASNTKTSGFTLIEMLVVVLIMGLCIGLVSGVARPDDRAVLRLEADRLAQLLDLASEQARLGGKAIAWSADASGYRFTRLTDDTWSALGDNDVLRPRALPRGMMITAMQLDNLSVRGAMRLEFAPYASPQIFTIAMTLGSEHCAIAESGWRACFMRAARPRSTFGAMADGEDLSRREGPRLW